MLSESRAALKVCGAEDFLKPETGPAQALQAREHRYNPPAHSSAARVPLRHQEQAWTERRYEPCTADTLKTKNLGGLKGHAFACLSTACL